MADIERRRTEPPEVRRTQILDAAKRRFREHGFHATKMADVAGEAGVSVGLIYRHFPSKEALIEGIAVQDMERQLEQFAAILAEHPHDIVAAISAGARALGPMMLDRERTGLMLEIAAEATRNRKIRDFSSEVGQRVHAMLRDRVMALKPGSVSARELEVRFQVLAGMIQGVSIQIAVQKQAPDPLLFQVMEQTAKLLMAPEHPIEG